MLDHCNSVESDEAETRRANSSTHKKRRLNTVKCDRCRRDKQRCDPVNRIWPEKCNRCASKDLPCSEGKKACRVGKQDLESEQDPDASESGDTDGYFQKLVSHWMVLSRYRKNLSSLHERMNDVWQESNNPFPSHGSYNGGGFVDSETLIATTTGAVQSGLEMVARALMNSTLARTLPETLLPMFLEAENPYPDIMMEDCKECICIIRTQDPFLRTFSLNGDVFGEFITWQRLLLRFMDSRGNSSSCNYTNGCIQKAMSQYCKMAKLSLCLVVEVLKDLGDYTAAGMAQKVGLHQPKSLGHYLYESLDDVADIPVVLEQNALQQWLSFSGSHGRLPRKPSLMEINKQDLLGRSSLHIACLRNSETVVAALLEQGANTNARTMCGRTALHCAAANNNRSICERLLGYCGRSQIEVQDTTRRMARDYTKLADIVKLLDSHAGRGDGVGRPANAPAESSIDLTALPNAYSTESSATGGKFYVSQLRAPTSALHDRHGPEGGWVQTTWPSTPRPPEVFQVRGHDGIGTVAGGEEGIDDGLNQRSMRALMEASLDMSGFIPPYDYHL